MPTRIAIDAMGGDHAPRVNLLGALEALAAEPALSLTLVGDAMTLRQELGKLAGQESDRLEIFHADDVISMKDHAASVVRAKKNSSIHLGLGLVKDQKADAFISAGNSGAVMACSLKILGRLPGVERPAIIVKIPTATGFSILLDAGANVDCKISQLVQFADMGRVYAEMVEGISRPRVGLLSNASETHKGNETTREVDAILGARPEMNYIGPVEGHDLFSGITDVLVCDGFVGNILLKSTEGVASTCVEWFKKEVQSDLSGLLGVFLMKKLLKKFRNKFDSEPYGAAPLLGINGVVYISHGGSTEVAIRNGILTAARAIENQFLDKITSQFRPGETQPHA